MSITVANLMAQVGADLTQFRLGMNEVDARLNQVKQRSAASVQTVKAMRGEAQRLTSEASSLNMKKIATDAAAQAATALAGLQKQAVGNAQAEVAKAEAALKAAQSKKQTKKNTAATATADAELKKTNEILAKAQTEYDKTARSADRLSTSVIRLGNAEASMRRRAINLAMGADNNEILSKAAADVARASAARLKQNSNEHRIRALNNISGTAETAGLFMAGGLALATKEGADYNQMMVQTAHNTQLTTDGIKVMNATVRQLGQESGGDLNEIAQGFRLMTDYGNSAAQSQKMMKVAMEASVATGSDLVTTSELLAKATKEFNLPVDQAATTMGIMVEAGRRSTMTQEQLVHVGGQLYATAANLGVSFIDANAALVTYTKHGLDAANASTQLRNDINKIIAPTKAVRDVLADVTKRTGVDLVKDFSTTGLRTRTMLGIWQDIVKAAKLMHVNATDLTVKLFPNLRGTVGASIATGTGFKDLIEDRQKLTAVVDRARGGDPLQGAYKESLSQLNVQMERTKNTAILLAADISTVLTPSITHLLTKADMAVKSFTDMSDASKETWTKFAVGASVSLIVFGAVGKLIVGISALNTALITMNNVGILGTLGKMAPWIAIVLAAAAAAKYLYDRYRDLEGTSSNLDANLNKTIAAHIESARAGMANARSVAALIAQYHALSAKSKPTHKDMTDMQDILNKISLMAPDLITGYNNQGNAIALMGNAAHVTAQKLRDMNDAQAHAQALQVDKAAVDTAQTLDARKTDLERIRYSLKMGEAPDRDPVTGAYKWSTLPNEVSKNYDGMPYLSPNDNPWDKTGDYKYPEMHTMTPVERAQLEQQARDLQARINALGADYTRKHAQAQHIINAAKKPIIPAGGLAPLDPWGANQKILPAAADPLAGVGQKAKKSHDDSKRIAHEAIAYINELKKRQYELIHTGALAANEWEIQSGRLAGMGKHYADVSREIVKHTMALELNKRMTESMRNTALIGHDDIKGGMELAGGYDVWKDLSHKQRQAAITAFTTGSAASGLNSLGESMDKKLFDANYPQLGAVDELKNSVDDMLVKLHLQILPKSLRADYTRDLGIAGQVDEQTLDKYTKSVKRDVFDAGADIRASNAGKTGQIDIAMEKFKADNAERLQLMEEKRGKKATKHFLDDHKASLVKLYDLKQEVDAQKQIDDLTESSRRKSNELAINNPFLRWVETLKVWNKDKNTFELPKSMSLGMLRGIFDKDRSNEGIEKFDASLQSIKQTTVDLETMDPFEKWARQFKTFDTSLNDGKGGYLDSGVDAALSREMYNAELRNTMLASAQQTMEAMAKDAATLKERDPFKVWLQSYQVFDMTANGGKGAFITPGTDDADRKATEERLRTIYDNQSRINLVKQAAEGLTGVITGAINNGYEHGFNGMFQNIKDGFKRMLFDMAVQFLQSKLLQLIQHQLFGMAGGPGMTQGKSGGGGLLSLGSTILGIGSLFGGGGGVKTGGGSGGNLFSTPATSFNTGAFAARAMGGPIRAGQGYITGENGPELIVPRNDGYVYTSDQTRAMANGRGGTHNVYNINISTPDAGSFHRSSGAILDDVHKAAQRAAVRSR